MKKCLLCNEPLTDHSVDADKMINNEERNRLSKIRKKNGICSTCSTAMLMADIIGTHRQLC